MLQVQTLDQFCQVADVSHRAHENGAPVTPKGPEEIYEALRLMAKSRIKPLLSIRTKFRRPTTETGRLLRVTRYSVVLQLSEHRTAYIGRDLLGELSYMGA